VAIIGNGGLSTSYTTPIPLLGNIRGGGDLQQWSTSPTVSFSANASMRQNSIDISFGWIRNK
jgi:hypothetical protein